MLTGKGSQYAIDWRDEHGPSHGFRLKLFAEPEETSKVIKKPIDVEALRQGAETPDNIYVRLDNVASLFLNDSSEGGGCRFTAAVPWQGEDGKPMEVYISDEDVDQDCREYMERLRAKSKDSFWYSILKSFQGKLEDSAKESKVTAIEAQMRQHLATKLGAFLPSDSERESADCSMPSIDAFYKWDSYINSEAQLYDTEGNNEERRVADIILAEWKGWLVYLDPPISPVSFKPLAKKVFPICLPSRMPSTGQAKALEAPAVEEAESAMDGDVKPEAGESFEADTLEKKRPKGKTQKKREEVLQKWLEQQKSKDAKFDSAWITDKHEEVWKQLKKIDSNLFKHDSESTYQKFFGNQILCGFKPGPRS